MSPCERIAEALVTGVELGDDERAHLAQCAACRQLSVLPGLIAGSASAAPPHPGFSARVMVAARARIDQRRRRRFAGFGLALATVAALAVVADRGMIRRSPSTPTPLAGLPSAGPLDADLRRDLELLRTEDAMAPVAPWHEIEAPLHNYQLLLLERSPK